MKRWNPATRAWDIDYRPSKRQYPPLPLEIQKQLKAVEPTHDGMMEYFPCAVTLGTGEICECVYFANADLYIKFWGVWPDDDPGKANTSIGRRDGHSTQCEALAGAIRT